MEKRLYQSHCVFPTMDIGYGYDAYFITDKQEVLQKEFEDNGVKIVKSLVKTDYQNKEFVIEDNDGCWIGFGIKE